jgi:fermentation-respiration switch protein FrsA (DUF1100 family)
MLIFLSKVLITFASQIFLHPPRNPFRDTPATYNLQFEEVVFSSIDGIPLKGFFIEAKDSKRTVIICHGYSGNKDTELIKFARFLNKAGYNTLFFDFRGHGESGGDYTSLGYYEVQDLLGAIEYLKKNKNLEKIAVIGTSMGAATSLLTAAKSKEIKVLIEDSGFATIREGISCGLKTFGVPNFLIPFASYLIHKAMGWHLNFDIKEGEPIRFIKKISCPLLIIHGDRDSLIPVKNAYLIYKEANQPKEIWITKNIEHAQSYFYFKEEYEKRVLEFFEKYF